MHFLQYYYISFINPVDYNTALYTPDNSNGQGYKKKITECSSYFGKKLKKIRLEFG